MKIQKQKCSFPIAFTLALSSGIATFQFCLWSPAQATNIIKNEAAELSDKTQKKSAPDTLCFDANQLVQALTSDKNPLKIVSRDITGNRFVLQLRNVKIFGFSKTHEGKIVHVTVSGTGPEFDTSMDKIVELANADNKSSTAGIVTRLNKNLHGKRIPDECFQLTGTRYYLQRLSGVPTFHCTSTRADRKAILKAQPG